MTPYFITVFLTFLLAYLALPINSKAPVCGNEEIPKRTKFFLTVTALVLICVAGLRYYVGTDFHAYYRAFEIYAPNWWKSILELDEPGFPILSAILNWFTDDGAVFIFAASAITNGIILFITYKYVDTYLFSSLLFVFMGVWHGTFNGARQYFAAVIICLAHRYILDKKIWKYLLCVFIAFLFHSSAVIMIIPYFILRNKISIKNILILTIGSIVLLYNYEFIFSFADLLKDENINTSLEYMSKQVNILRIIVCIVPAVVGLFLYNKSEKTQENTFYLNILILYALLSVIGMNSPYLTRVNIYLQVLLPLAMSKIFRFKDKKTEMIIKWSVILLFLVFWYYEISTSSSLNNFRFVWDR